MSGSKYARRLDGRRIKAEGEGLGEAVELEPRRAPGLSIRPLTGGARMRYTIRQLSMKRRRL